MVLKTASGDARPFLELVQARDRSAQRYFANQAEVICGAMTQSGLAYPFVSVPSIRSLISRELSAKNPEAACVWLQRYADFLRTLPGKVCRPVSFLNFLGIPGADTAPVMACLNAGPIDLIPDNILFADSKWYICDNEFFFDWEIPIDLILYRGISTLVHRLQKEICGMRASWKLLPFSGRFSRVVYIPEPWIPFLPSQNVSLATLGRWGHAFEASIIPDASPSYLSTQIRALTGETLPSWAPATELIQWMAGRTTAILRKTLTRLTRA